MDAKIQALRERFEYLGWSPGICEASGETLLENNLSVIFNSTPPMAKVFVLLGCEQVYDAAGVPQAVLHHVELNRLTRRAANGRSQVYFLAPDDFIESPTDVIDATQWDRRVYFRIYQRIAELYRSGSSP